MKSSTPSFFTRLLAATFLLTCAASFTRAADINWGSAQDISGDSDVSISGTLIDAFNVGNTGVSSALANGVNFQSFAAPGGNGTVGNYTMSSGFAFADNTAAGSSNAPFTSLSADYQTLLAARVVGINAFDLTISGLAVGVQYQIQLWCNSSSDSNQYDTNITGGANDVTIYSNVGGMDGTLGQYVIGTFTADTTSQLFSFEGGEVSFLNAFQLRTAPASVPETGSSLAFLGLALGGLVIAERKLGRARPA